VAAVASLAGCRGAKASFACRQHHDTIVHDVAIPCPHIVTNPDLPPEVRSRPDLHPGIRSNDNVRAANNGDEIRSSQSLDPNGRSLRREPSGRDIRHQDAMYPCVLHSSLIGLSEEGPRGDPFVKRAELAWDRLFTQHWKPPSPS
jgi:hypothetical protein